MQTPESDQLPTELRAFLYSCIDSVEQAEILIFLRRTPRDWTVREVATELGLVEAAARRHVDSLAARGLLQVRVGNETVYRYHPTSAELRRYADLLAEYYATSRTAVLRFITTGGPRWKTFADAFKLRDSE